MSYQKRFFATPIIIASTISVIFIEVNPIKLNRIEYGLVCLCVYELCIAVYYFFGKKIK
jgi:hypothetical protein